MRKKFKNQIHFNMSRVGTSNNIWNIKKLTYVRIVRSYNTFT